ncbi:MAG: hypothetical protein HRT35_13205 [Algicola sp.]|nr:hypothetical protein [Algicola sp.]
MKFNTLIAAALITAALLSFNVQADIIKAGDLSVAGGTCLGFDCINGESLASGELKLKENNVRVRLTNTEVAKQSGAENVLGESWNIEANSSAKGGASYFGFGVKSVYPDTLLSNGTAKAYDCADLAVTKYDITNVPSIGTVPAGEAFFTLQMNPVSCDFGPTIECFHICEANTQLQHSAASILNLGTGADNSVTIGFNSNLSSSPDKGVVALGYNELKRQLLNVAKAFRATDALNVDGLKFTRIAAMSAQLTQLNTQLDVLKTRIDEYEDSLTVEVDMGSIGTTTRLDLTKKNQLIITDSTDFGQWGPRGITFGFSSNDGQPISGIKVFDTDSNSYELKGWWSVINRPLSAELVTLLLPEHPGRIINVQWWYSW